MISGLIHTKNEEKNIRNAVMSIKPWCDEVVVVDMQSSDQTVEICHELGCRIISVSDMNYVEPAREIGRNSCEGEWIMILDADEMVSRSLATFLRDVAENDTCDAVAIPRMNFMFGHWISGLTWWPDYQIRFFKKDSLSWGSAIHTPPQMREGRSLAHINLSGNPYEYSILHFNYINSAHFVDKLNRYTNYEVEKHLSANEHFSTHAQTRAVYSEMTNRLSASPISHVPDEVVDGLTKMMGFYRWLEWFKLWEVESGHSAQNIDQTYLEIKKQTLMEWTHE